MNIILPTNNVKTKNFRIVDGILHVRYGKSFERIVYSLTYFMKGRNFCYYCKKKIARNEMTLDHMYPRFTGGITITQNLIPACRACNSQKSYMTFEQYKKYLALSDRERCEYLSKLSVFKDGINNIGIYEIPNQWITPVLVKDIHTAIDFANISETKFQKVKSYYDMYHKFQVPMLLDRNFYSLDGFYILFVAKANNIKFVPAIILDNVEISVSSKEKC